MKITISKKLFLQSVKKNVALLLAGIVLVLISVAACVHDISGDSAEILVATIKAFSIYLPAIILIIFVDYFILLQAKTKENEEEFLNKAWKTEKTIIWTVVFVCFVMMALNI